MRQTGNGVEKLIKPRTTAVGQFAGRQSSGEAGGGGKMSEDGSDKFKFGIRNVRLFVGRFGCKQFLSRKFL